MKGVNTLIATVLLLAITVLISLIVSTSFTQITKEQTSTVATRTSQAVNCTSSDVNIEAVYLDTAANRGRVTVRNSGQINENIVAAKMYNKTGVEAALNATTLPVAISKGSLTTLNFDITTNVTCASFSQVILSTECTTEVFDSTPKNC